MKTIIVAGLLILSAGACFAQSNGSATASGSSSMDSQNNADRGTGNSSY